MHTRMTEWLTDPEAALSIPFLSTFAKKASGGSSDDNDDSDDDDDDEEDDDDSDDDDDEDEDADKSDEEIRAELKSIREQLKKANDSSAKRRRALREREAELAEARKPKPKKDGDDDKPDIDAIKAEAKAEAKTEADNRIKRSEAKAALIGAGLSREVAADLVAFVNLADLDIEGDEVEGLDEEIERIKKKYPGFFTAPGGRRRRDSVAGKGDRDGDGGVKKKLTASERQAAVLTGRG